MASGSRREARERALELLYEADAKGVPADRLVDELAVVPDQLTVELVRGVAAEQRAIDDKIEARLRSDWAIGRVAVVDLAILRLATYELVHRADTPPAVVLSEAVELAKRYSTEDSGRFVNGVLAAIARDLRPATPADS